MYTENYKMLLKVIREDTREWEDILCCGLEDSIAIKCPYYTKRSMDSIQSLIKIPITFVEMERKKCQTGVESQGIPNSQNNLGKEEQSWRPHAS